MSTTCCPPLPDEQAYDRRDVVGNCAVWRAVLGVFGAHAGWPDVTVACIVCALALRGTWQLVSPSRHELTEV